MKTVFYILLVIIGISSCKKKEDPLPYNRMQESDTLKTVDYSRPASITFQYYDGSYRATLYKKEFVYNTDSTLQKIYFSDSDHPNDIDSAKYYYKNKRVIKVIRTAHGHVTERTFSYNSSDKIESYSINTNFQYGSSNFYERYEYYYGLNEVSYLLHFDRENKLTDSLHVSGTMITNVQKTAPFKVSEKYFIVNDFGFKEQDGSNEVVLCKPDKVPFQKELVLEIIAPVDYANYYPAAGIYYTDEYKYLLTGYGVIYREYVLDKDKHVLSFTDNYRSHPTQYGSTFKTSETIITY